MNELNDLINQNARQVAREFEKILADKLKQIIAAIEDERAGSPDEPSNEKQQLCAVLKNLVESNEQGLPVNVEFTREQLTALGYQLEMQQPSFRDYTETVREQDGSHSFRVNIPNDQFKIRLYKLEYEA